MQIPSTLQEQQEMDWAFLPEEHSNRRMSPFGSTGKELMRLAKELSDYWEVRCTQSHILRKPDDPLPYRPMPPKRTCTVPVRYHIRGRGKPLPYQTDDKE